MLTLDFSAVDEGSGVKSLEAKLDGEVVTDGQVIDLYTLALGDHIFEVKAVDNLDSESSASVTFSITANKDSLIASLRRFYSEGAIDSKGVLNSLIMTIQQQQTNDKKGTPKSFANQLRALINELQAQSGIHITTEAADLLIADAQWAIEHLK